MPYSNRELPEYALQKPWSPEFDLWSLGIIILQVLVGQEMVTKMNSDEDVREVLELAKPLIGADLHFLVSRMTIFVDDKVVKSFLLDHNSLNTEKVRLVVQAVVDARLGGGTSDQIASEQIRDKKDEKPEEEKE